MSKRERNTIPVLQRLNKNETQCIVNAFKFYDINSTGRIAPHLARKLMRNLGLTIPPEEGSTMFGTSDIALYDLLVLIDKLIPEPEPILLSSLESFGSFAGVVQDDKKVINPTSIAKFMESLGRPPINMNEASLMLNGMLDYDDCSEIPLVQVEVFNKEVINFAKKSNAFKEYRS